MARELMYVVDETNEVRSHVWDEPTRLPRGRRVLRAFNKPDPANDWGGVPWPIGSRIPESQIFPPRS
jgi:hypothetical protein